MSKFTSQTAREAGKKSKRGPSKRLEPNIEEKMKLLYEDVLDDLLLNSKDLSPSEKILENFILKKVNFWVKKMKKYSLRSFPPLWQSRNTHI